MCSPALLNQPPWASAGWDVRPEPLNSRTLAGMAVKAKPSSHGGCREKLLDLWGETGLGESRTEDIGVSGWGEAKPADMV